MRFTLVALIVSFATASFPSVLWYCFSSLSLDEIACFSMEVPSTTATLSSLLGMYLDAALKEMHAANALGQSVGAAILAEEIA